MLLLPKVLTQNEFKDSSGKNISNCKRSRISWNFNNFTGNEVAASRLFMSLAVCAVLGPRVNYVRVTEPS